MGRCCRSIHIRSRHSTPASRRRHMTPTSTRCPGARALRRFGARLRRGDEPPARWKCGDGAACGDARGDGRDGDGMGGEQFVAPDFPLPAGGDAQCDPSEGGLQAAASARRQDGDEVLPPRTPCLPAARYVSPSPIHLFASRRRTPWFVGLIACPSPASASRP
ncbi:hypothetical protein DFH06DRAFT_1175051 [Mycena polygramma]|nr:hypothetical protein DFH06DRAFT_1175051 [Mycena polygramma]